MTPSVAVLTPSYNDGRFLPDCLTSVREAAQKADITVQHVVVDDGSTDDTQAVLNQFANLTRVRFPSNRGASAALNFALGMVASDWCLILAADDMVTDTAFGSWQRAVADHPHANVICSDLELFGDRRGLYSLPAFDRGELRRRNILPGAAFIRRDLLMAVGGFDARLRSAQDWDFWVRADHAVGLAPVMCPTPLVRYRWQREGRLHNESVRNIAQLRLHIWTHTPATAVLSPVGAP